MRKAETPYLTITDPEMTRVEQIDYDKNKSADYWSGNKLWRNNQIIGINRVDANKHFD